MFERVFLRDVAVGEWFTLGNTACVRQSTGELYDDSWGSTIACTYIDVRKRYTIYLPACMVVEVRV